VSKANILNKQFESVFSKPSPLGLKQLAKSSMSKLGHPAMPPITITVQRVDKLLTGLNPNKAQGLDEISPRLLKGKLSDSFTNYNYVGNTKVRVSIKKT